MLVDLTVKKAEDLKNKKSQYNKNYYTKNKDKIKKNVSEYYKNYYKNNKQKISGICSRYYLRNKEKINLRNKQYYIKNKTKVHKRIYSWKKQCMEKWLAIIPKITLCQACGKEIHFNQYDITKAIHFDHRHAGLEIIKGSPRRWLTVNPPNEKNIKIWESCNFGMLCRYCNFTLPTKNRKNHVIGLIKYVFGKNINLDVLLQLGISTNQE